MNVPARVRTVRRVAFGAVGILATAFGVVVLLLPGLASMGPAAVALRQIEGMAVNRALLIAGALAVGALVLGARTASRPVTGDDRLDRRLDELSTAPPEQVTAGESRVAAADLDATATAAIEDGGEPYREVQAALERTAAAAYADATGVSRPEAAAAVAAGTWTRDPVASAVLADESGPRLGRRRTLRLLAIPGRERDERLRRTIAAIEELEAK